MSRSSRERSTKDLRERPVHAIENAALGPARKRPAHAAPAVPVESAEPVPDDSENDAGAEFNAEEFQDILGLDEAKGGPDGGMAFYGGEPSAQNE
jgi:hypothetical protein